MAVVCCEIAMNVCSPWSHSKLAERQMLAHFPGRAYDGFPAHSFRTRAEPRARCDSSRFFARAGARSARSRMGVVEPKAP